MVIEKEFLKLDFKFECFFLMKGDYFLVFDRFNYCIWKVDEKGNIEFFIKIVFYNLKGLCLNKK